MNLMAKAIKKLKTRKPKDAQDVANIMFKLWYVTCSRIEYHDYIRLALTKFIKMASEKKSSKKALHAIKEITRLDQVHGTQPTAEDYEFFAARAEMRYPD